MLKGSPFHERTFPLCQSWAWQAWSGYLSASSYSVVPYMEYYAIRHTAGLIDVSPLYKYRIQGKDALRVLNKIVTRDLTKFSARHIVYTPWCDERGKVVDDGTIWNYGDGSFRLTSAEPSLKWIEDNAVSLDVKVEDVSEDIGTLSLQGPISRAVLRDAAGPVLDKLKFFRFTSATIDGVPVEISRTGYTGDLGYEIWVQRDGAERLFDALMKYGAPHHIQLAGQVAMDARVVQEAAGPGRFILGFGTSKIFLNNTKTQTRKTLGPMRDAVTIVRGILGGERFDYDGDTWSADVPALAADAHAPREVPPVYVAATAPKMQALAGEIGDGCLTPSITTPAFVRYTVGNVAAPIDIGCTVVASIHETDRDAGRDEAVRVTVDAAGYRERREQMLHRQADQAAERAARSGRPVALDAMSATERKVVHEHLKDRDDVETYSEGTEPDRHLVVAPIR